MEKRGHEGDGGGGARARTFNYYIIGGYLLYIGWKGRKSMADVQDTPRRDARRT